MSLSSAFDRLHARATEIPAAHALAEFSRLAIAVGFIAPGLTKILGFRFAYWSVDTPGGYYFDAIYGTGLYYQFIGIAQVVSGTLLLFRRTSALGAVLYFPIILNIFLLTVSMGFHEFRFTILVTGLMTLACLFLLCWNYPAWKGLLFPVHPSESLTPSDSLAGVSRLAWWMAAIGGVGFTSFQRGLIRPGLVPLGLLGMLALAVVLAAYVWYRRRVHRSRLTIA